MATATAEVIDDNSKLNTEKDKLCEYPPNVAGRISVYKQDLETLDGRNWLNDKIIGKFIFEF